MSEIAFNKYQTKGAYHWTEVFGPVYRLNAYTMARYELIIRALLGVQIGKGDRVLDVGCGDAALGGLVVMRTQAAIEGIDTSPLSIEIAQREFARHHLDGRFAVVDGYTYSYDGGQFRAVICSDVIEHVQKPDSLLLEMWRVLTPGGVLVMTTPVRYTEAPLDRMHVQEWFPSEFRNFCARTLGVDVEHAVSHPAAFAELYASPTNVGRLTRLLFNIFAKSGNNPFLWISGLRAFSTQIVVARKPALS